MTFYLERTKGPSILFFFFFFFPFLSFCHAHTTALPHTHTPGREAGSCVKRHPPGGGQVVAFWAWQQLAWHFSPCCHACHCPSPYPLPHCYHACLSHACCLYMPANKNIPHSVHLFKQQIVYVQEEEVCTGWKGGEEEERRTGGFEMGVYLEKEAGRRRRRLEAVALVGMPRNSSLLPSLALHICMPFLHTHPLCCLCLPAF